MSPIQTETTNVQNERTLTKVYSRVNGWLTSVDSWNKGKTAEWADRKPYKVE